MPAGVPVATFAIGEAGATNAALFAAQILALDDAAVAAAVTADRRARHDEATATRLPPS
jgi:5-(carboxyamino)imidazole ribonucleotide mutase